MQSALRSVTLLAVWTWASYSVSLSLPLPFPLPFIKQEGESRLYQDPFAIHHSPGLFQFLENPVLSTCWLLHAWLPLPVRLTSAPPHLSMSPPPRSLPGLRLCSRYTQCSHAHIPLGQNPQLFPAHWLPGVLSLPTASTRVSSLTGCLLLVPVVPSASSGPLASPASPSWGYLCLFSAAVLLEHGPESQSSASPIWAHC